MPRHSHMITRRYNVDMGANNRNHLRYLDKQERLNCRKRFSHGIVKLGCKQSSKGTVT